MIRALVLTVLSIPEATQPVKPAGQPALFPEATARILPWPGTIPALAKGRMVAGDVTGDGQKDAVLLNGGKPVVVYAPALHTAIFEIDLLANDVALLDSAAAPLVSDVVLVGPDGLVRLSGYDGGAFDLEILGSAAWVDARRVLAADADGDGVEDLVGVSADGELLFLEDVNGPDPVEIVRPFGETVLDLAVLDWEGDGEFLPHVALLSPSGLTVQRHSGAIAFSLAFPSDGGALAVLEQSNVPFERLAVLGGEQAAQALCVVDRNGAEAPVPLGAAGVFALTSADADLDGYDDLYGLHRLSHETALLFNRTALGVGGPTFLFAARSREVVEVAQGVPPASWSAWPALADFSADGDADLLVFVESTNALFFVENTRTDGDALEVTVAGGGYVHDAVLEQGELHLIVTVPDGLDFQPTHVEIVGWKQANATAGGIVVEPVAVAHGYALLDGELEAHCQVVLDEDDLFTPHIYYFELRAVHLSGDAVVKAGPTAAHAFTTPASLVAGLEAQFGEGIPLRVFVIEDGEEIELDDAALAERLLAPKEVKTDTIPLIDFPPNPFG